MLAQTEINHQIELANALYDENNATSFRHLTDDVLRTNYVAGWLTSAFNIEITNALTLIDSYIETAETIEDEIYNTAWDTYCCLVEDEGITWLTFDDIYTAVSRHAGNVDAAVMELM